MNRYLKCITSIYREVFYERQRKGQPFILFLTLVLTPFPIFSAEHRETSSVPDTTNTMIQGLHRAENPLQEELTVNPCDIVLPKDFDAHAKLLMDKWNKAFGGYTSRQNNHPIFEDSDYSRRERLQKLPTTIQMPYNDRVKKSIAVYIKGKRQFIPAMLSLGDYYFPIIETVFDRYDIPLELKYLAVVESGLDPLATSSSGAKGLWQFMLVTAKAYGLEVNSLVDERCDVYKSTVAVAKHLKDLYFLYEDWLVAIAAYNAGIGNVNKALRRSGGKRDFFGIYNYLPRQTRDYVPLFIGAFYVMEYHEDYNIHRVPCKYPTDLDTLTISRRMSIAEIVNSAGVTEDFFHLVNPQYKTDYVPGNIKNCVVTLPIGAIARLEIAMNEGSLNQSRQKKSQELPSSSPSNFADSSSSSLRPARSYTIRRGDSLYKIARKHGISLQALMQENDIRTTGYKLIPGETLKIPAKDA